MVEVLFPPSMLNSKGQAFLHYSELVQLNNLLMKERVSVCVCVCVCVCVVASVVYNFLWLHGLPGSSVHGIFQARIL